MADFRQDDLFKSQFYGFKRAGQADDDPAERYTGGGAAEDAAAADLLVGQVAEKLAEAVQPFSSMGSTVSMVRSILLAPVPPEVIMT